MFCGSESETEFDPGFTREGALHGASDGNAPNEAEVGPGVVLFTADRLSRVTHV